MTKTLAVLGIAGAAMAALALVVLANLAIMLVPLFAIVAGVFILRERNPIATTLAIAIFLVSLASILGAMGSFTFKESAVDFGISVEVGVLLAAVAGLLVAAAVTLLRRDTISPEWLAFAGLGAAALAVVVAIVGLQGLTDHASPLTLVAGALALAAMAPSVSALRNEA